ncbi:MAG: HAD family hydrolase [Clostridiaceae bacterium]|nr:HAD family hydrolase [Clostridiaceae bacterium]
MRYKHIVWDWNGTLLNDAQACVNSVNKILVSRNMRPVTLKEYKSKIEFPVINMYKDSGFDFGKESFDDLSEEYVQNYLDQFDSIDLHDDARSVLTGFKNLGLKQYIVSASGYQILMDQVERYGLKEFFTQIMGQDNNRGESKVHLAQKLAGSLNCSPGEILFIGDTPHDYEVSKEAGFDVRLVSNGHCSLEKLMATGAKVYPNLTELFNELIKA